jgi:hypothetical protein
MAQTIRFPFAVGKYNFDWEENQRFNDPRYNSPIPCSHGSNCFYHGKMGPNGKWINDFCRRVHPGEEGVGRKLFRARNKFETDVVRLYGDMVNGVLVKQTFYERIRLGKTWPQWCEMTGRPVPTRPQQKQEKEEEQFIVSFTEQDQKEEEENIRTTLTNPNADIRPTITPEQVAGWKQYVGSHIYHIVDTTLCTREARAEMMKAGWYAPTITAGKIMGMIIEACSLQEIIALYNNHGQLNDAIMDCCEVLQEAYN